MIETIAVGTDGSETAQKAVDFAVDLAKRCHAKLVLAGAYKPVSDQPRPEGAARRARTRSRTTRRARRCS